GPDLVNRVDVRSQRGVRPHQRGLPDLARYFGSHGVTSEWRAYDLSDIDAQRFSVAPRLRRRRPRPLPGALGAGEGRPDARAAGADGPGAQRPPSRDVVRKAVVADALHV